MSNTKSGRKHTPIEQILAPPVGPMGPQGIAGRDGADGINGKDGVAGPSGRDGRDGRDGKDGAGLNWKGNWKESELYQKNDVVNYLGSSYVALADSRSDYPNRINNSWDLLAAAGAGGARGPAGSTAVLSDHLGFADYNDTSTASTPVAIVADTWTTLPNDGLGGFSQEQLPTGITTLLDPSTGAIDISELPQYSDLIIRPDFTVTPNSNNAALEFRFLLGTGAGEYTLPTSFGRLDQGAGVEYRRSTISHYIYAGDSNTIDNPIYLQIKLSASGTLVNAGMAIKVYKR